MTLALVAGLALATSHSEGIETPVYLLVFLVVIPGLAVGLRARRTSVPAVLVFSTAGAIGATILLARVVGFVAGTRPALVVLLVGSIGISAGALALTRRTPNLRAGTLERWRTARAIAAALLALCALSFYPSGFFRPAELWLFFVVVAGVVAALVYRPVRLGRSSRRRRRIVDAVVVLLIPLLVTDLNRYGDEFRYDYDFILGPVNAVRHGHPMLVDTFSQYGVGMFYALALAFEIVPLSYGGLQVVLGVGYVLEFVAVYAILRLVSRSQLAAVTALAFAVAANLAVPKYLPAISYPSTGPLRFCLPWLAILFAVLLVQARRGQIALRTALYGTIALAAVWSVETFVYTVGAYAGLVAARWAFSTGTRRERTRAAAADVGLACGASIAAIAGLSVATRVLGDAWPSWGTYADVVALYATEGFGTLLISRWSPAYLVASLYAVSMVALLVLANERVAARLTRPASTRALVALGGATAYGIVAFSYYLGRSAPSNLHHLAVTAVVLVAAWYSLTTDLLTSARSLLVARVTLVVVGVSLVVHTVGAIVSVLDAATLTQVVRSPREALAHVASLGSRSAYRAHVQEAASLIDRHTSPGAAPVVLVRSDLLTGALLASSRGNALPIVNGNQDRLVGDASLKLVARAADKLTPGTVLLTETLVMTLPPEPLFDSLDPAVGNRRFGDPFVALALAEVRTRFKFRLVERGRFGLVVFELRPRP